MTFRKLLNALSVYFFYLMSVLFKTTKRGGFPTGISIEPGTACNLQCTECPSGQRAFTRPTGSINVDFFRKITDEFAPYLTSMILYFQGEPFLHKAFFDLVHYASSEKNIFTITSTNGHYLTPDNSEKIIKSGLDKIILSMDGTNQAVYEKYRVNGNLSRVKEGIKNLVDKKRELKSATPFIELQFIVFKHNEHQISEIEAYAKTAGVDLLSLKSAQIYDFETNTDLISSIDKYARYRKNTAGVYQIKSKLRNRCKRLWETIVVTWDGKVLPCCFDKDADFVSGDLQIHNFREIDKSEKAVSFRKELLMSRKSIHICNNCTEGLKM